MACNQMIDFLDFEFELPKPEPKPRPKCTCGSWAIGCKPYMAGHDDNCDVNENKTPVMADNPYYEKESAKTR